MNELRGKILAYIRECGAKSFTEILHTFNNECGSSIDDELNSLIADYYIYRRWINRQWYYFLTSR